MTETIDEVQAIRNLLLEHRSGRSNDEILLAERIANACLQGGHLWEDLNLENRGELTRLMLCHFFPLASRNNWDMRWKKFLYRQLCESMRGALCRTPNCSDCHDYEICYPEKQAVA